MKKFSLITLLLAFSVLVAQCDKDDYENNPGSSNNTGNGGGYGYEYDDDEESRHFSTESHNMGQACMQCHDGSDREAPRFTVAGTVYKAGGQETAPNGYVTLYSEANAQGKMVLRLEVDAYGNFYTVRPIDWSNGLYPVVEGATGGRSVMSISTTQGNCNSCHTDSGNPTNRIEI